MLIALVSILISLSFVVLIVLLYQSQEKCKELKSMVEWKSLIQVQVWKADPYTQNHEKILMGSKEALECFSILLGHKFWITNDKLHDKWISNEQFRYTQWQCDAYLTLKISVDNLIKKNK